jgi:hypothetical protein
MRRLRKKDRTLSLPDVRAHPLFQVPQDTSCDDPFALPIGKRPENFIDYSLTCHNCLLPVFKDKKSLNWHLRNECTETPNIRARSKVGWRLTAREKEQMPLTLKDLGITPGGAMRKNLLHGKDVPKGTDSFPISIERVRQAPKGWNAVLILDLKKPVFGKDAWVVNTTNTQILSGMCKGGDLETLAGKTITLWLIDTETPDGEAALGLSAAEPE